MRELKAINDILTDKLTTMEQAALARLLEAARAEKREERKAGVPEEYTSENVYTAAADFLWMAYRITNEEKNELLDLLDELPDNAEGWWDM